jgi:hypothetical protein
LKNSVFQSDVLKSGNFRHVQWSGITFNAANFKELHSTCRCGRENLPEFLSQEFFNTISMKRTPKAGIKNYDFKPGSSAC